MPQRPIQSDPLAAIPMIAPSVDARTEADGVVQLRQKRALGGGALGRLCSRMGFSPDRRINLDARASRFWSLIDGQRTLHEIADRVATEWSVSPTDARSLAVQFTRDLMIRELIVLRVEQPATPVNQS